MAFRGIFPFFFSHVNKSATDTLKKKVELKIDLLISLNGFEEVFRFSFLLKG